MERWPLLCLTINSAFSESHVVGGCPAEGEAKEREDNWLMVLPILHSMEKRYKEEKGWECVWFLHSLGEGAGREAAPGSKS